MGEYYGGSEGGGPPFDLYAYVLKEDTAFGLQRSSIFIRGKRKTVQITLNTGSPVTAARAKTLKGRVSILVVTLGGGCFEFSMAATRNTKRTVDANGAGRTFAEVRSDIAAFLDSIGFPE
jgi:hypothetical protein